MTADGETNKYVLEDQDKAVYDAINVVGEFDNLDKTAETAKYLYVFSIDDDEITLSPLAATAAGIKELDENGDVINGYYVGAGKDWDVTDDLFGDEIVLENIYFVLEDDELTVKTLEELEDSTAENLYWEGLYDNGSKLHSMVAGFIAVDTFAEYDSGAYLYLTDDVYSDDSKNYKADVVFADEDKEPATIVIDKNTTDATQIEMYTLYKYTVRNDKYTLVKVDAEQKNVQITVKSTNKLDELKSFEIQQNGAYELVEKFTGDSIYVDTGASKLSRYDLSGYTIAVKSTILDLDRDEDDVIEVSYDIEFVTLDELKEMDEIFNSTEENRDWYFSDFTYAEDDLFYVELYRITEVCQEKLPEEASH